MSSTFSFRNLNANGFQFLDQNNNFIANLSNAGLLKVSGGLNSQASSTIGNGTQAGGLTVSGGATTTGFLTVQSTATSSFAGALTVSTAPTFVLANPEVIIGNSLSDTRAQFAAGRLIEELHV